mgnify:CR=1 FL=1
MQNYLPACKIVSTHGVRGEMKALPLCDGAQFLAKFKRLYAAANGSGEVALRGVRAQGNMLLVKLAGWRIWMPPAPRWAKPTILPRRMPNCRRAAIY